MKSERLFYLDFIRAVAAVSIVLTHFNARYLMLNPPMPEKAVITASVGGDLYRELGRVFVFYHFRRRADVCLWRAVRAEEVL